MPEGHEMSPSPSSYNQPYPSSDIGKNPVLSDKIRQNTEVGPGLNSNMHNIIPNLQNMNPNMQSSPNLTHSNLSPPNLSINFQNLSPIPNNPTSENSVQQIMQENDFQRMNPSSSMNMPAQWNNGNNQVNLVFAKYLEN